MEAKELRQGNYVFYNDKELGEVSGTLTRMFKDNEVFINDRIDISYNETNISPIPLTEDWLVKFGYAQNKTVADMFEDETRLNIWRSPHDFNGFIADWDALTLRAIEYVHQLQNLYFALTGEELNLKTE